MANNLNNNFDGSHVIGNLKVSELSNQKKRQGVRSTGPTPLQNLRNTAVIQVPFSLAVGPTQRGRAKPYAVSTSEKIDNYFKTEKPHKFVD